MPMMENISILTQAVRTLLVLAVTAFVGWAAWYGWTVVDARDREAREASIALQQARLDLDTAKKSLVAQEARIDELNQLVESKQAEIERLDAAMRLLKVDHRVALLTVEEQGTDADGQIYSVVEFQELDDRGESVGAAKRFRIAGDVVYIDGWLVKFDDEYVEQADLDRATSLVLFRRIFGEEQKPSEGFPLDEAGSRPQIYGQGGRMTDWERQIWDDFWSVANDQRRQQELGVRAAHGEAPSIKVRTGKQYRISIRASGGLNVQVEDAPPEGPPT